MLLYKDGKPKLWKQKYWKKILKIYAKETVFKGKDKHLELQKDFIKLKDRELKDREVKIKREIKIYYCPIIVFIDDMEKFQKKMKKKTN